VEAATSWMRSNSLQPIIETKLNGTAGRRQHQLPTSVPLIDGCSVSPLLSASIDYNLSMGWDAGNANSIVVLCLSASTTSEPSLGTDSQVPDAGGRSGAFLTGLL